MHVFCQVMRHAYVLNAFSSPLVETEQIPVRLLVQNDDVITVIQNTVPLVLWQMHQRVLLVFLISELFWVALGYCSVLRIELHFISGGSGNRSTMLITFWIQRVLCDIVIANAVCSCVYCCFSIEIFAIDLADGVYDVHSCYRTF